uniref:C2H2-type domain-containing protein n=1 Tax=Neogobius melanostomus TaxID=47308 RepID=A0A8C6TH16_9GOBI
MSVNTTALRDLVVERLVVAADEIFALFEQTFTEYQAVLRSKLLQDHKYHIQPEPKEELLKEDIQTVVVQTDVGPNFERIKYEEEEIPLDLQFPVPHLTATSEAHVDKSTLFQHQPAEERGPGAVKVSECEGDEPGCSLDFELAPCSFSDTDDSDDWEPSPKKKRKPRKRKNGLGQNKRKDVKERRGNAATNEEEQCAADVSNPPFIDAKVQSFSCSLCNNSFSEKQYLSQHMRVHTGERPYRCEPCGMTFRFRQNFYQHNLVVHPKEKPHRCQVCDKEFADSCELIAHKETHKDKEPYKCLNCNKTFMCIKSLMSHKMSERCL